MSACETCWAEASRKALMLGGSTADRYRVELAAHPEHSDIPPVSVASTDADITYEETNG